MKDAFASQISHELKTPLNGIIGMAELLQTSAGDEREEMLRQLQLAGEDLAAIVDNLLTLQGLTAYKPQLVLVPTRIAVTVESAVVTQTRHARRPRDRVQVQIDARVPDVILCDRARLQTALGNVLSNALRFSGPESRVDVSLDVATASDLGVSSPEDAPPDTQYLTVVITDRGEGIDGDADRVFEAFHQGGRGADGGDTPRRGHSGAGVGLTVARALLQAHGGDVRVKSTTRGQGTSMEAFIRIVHPPASPSLAVARPPLLNELSSLSIPRPAVSREVSASGKTVIMAVDDEPINLVRCRRSLPYDLRRRFV
jgi:signal transduction histidine kinase